MVFENSRRPKAPQTQNADKHFLVKRLTCGYIWLVKKANFIPEIVDCHTCKLCIPKKFSEYSQDENEFEN
jgi:hypothetical protein